MRQGRADPGRVAASHRDRLVRVAIAKCETSEPLRIASNRPEVRKKSTPLETRRKEPVMSDDDRVAARDAQSGRTAATSQGTLFPPVDIVENEVVQAASGRRCKWLAREGRVLCWPPPHHLG